MNTLATLETMGEYAELLKYSKDLEAKDKMTLMRELCRSDLYFLLRYPLKRVDVENDWLFERAGEESLAARVRNRALR